MYLALEVSEIANAVQEDKMKSLHIDVGRNEITSQIGDSGYTSLPGLPYTGLVTPINTLELASRLAETEINENSEVSQSDMESQNAIYFKNSAKNILDKYEQETVLCEKKLNLFHPKMSYNVSLENPGAMSLMETQFRANAFDDSRMSTASSVWGEDRDFISTSGSENWEVPSSQLLEQLSTAGTKGSQRSEVQLRLV